MTLSPHIWDSIYITYYEFCTIKKHFFTTCTNPTGFGFQGPVPIIVPNVWANEQSKRWHPLPKIDWLVGCIGV